jgi:transcriptional regulator with XRE-family HTH domain
MTFGEYLRKKRIEKGLTQKQVADLLGYQSSQFVSNNERDVSLPSMKNLPRICQVLEIDEEVMKDFFIQDFLKRVESCFAS